ncbi:hypothetical protein EDB92DRAFT_1932619 [Lactarius akahatsu]|uniref:Uncharacterized protein n=1 Tax=Lactarius akahatsu TaxID=416441 RepID=A0AAD4LST6_9AGAM|nr:hypothetical protein EDB92DRAFT_1932619 [Lactarius akahatsu]
MTARRDELFASHRCRPWVTMLVPPLTQLPLFVGSSMFLSRLSQPPTVFDSESFLTLTSLAHADPTAALPIALGIITLANVESSRWFISKEAKERDELEQRGILSVGRILIGSVVPGSVLLYWVSSATFGLLQSWVFDYWERQRSNRRKLNVLQTSSASPKSSGKSALAPVPVLKPKRK